ncbi:hypothetical protein P3X46_018160 [Hevea brasiliensis]|uniref:RING-type domain-containing protein n=1 Tax=Hevea brasiliensis TaxID=3981 RepID=A0ABQ9LRV6_HEVBR|nr:uncharacterized protein LOC110651155 [Hevea brasiliensis]XP_021662088.2 uncharacterized protein LOC110651155 [Hevea brasiliensis]XP_021662089.2 uncharacterized protein LOC110651155 [Hevea brasiliensis]XP_021662090.2 uncharacterized protein LOC110651155 [Hevea brasiliensis]KAJ9170023.1 hypothetical protein P3X46_018160 [Hevea brasiliensis]
MNGLDGFMRWKNLKQRLSFKGLGCCGGTWTPRATIRTIIEEDEEEEEEEEEEPIIIQEQGSDQPVVSFANASQLPVGNSNNDAATAGINLGMALAAERNLRRENVGPLKNDGPVKTLMRLIEETDGVDWRTKKRRENEYGGGGGIGNENDWVCCVCMDRNKGAAFIPCGHTFCRVCSREMWANRGSCPICNRSILEILDIF